MKKNMKYGLSLISLIITVIVIIILATIVIFSGLKTPDRANFAKFAEDFSSYKTAIAEDFMKKKTAYALEEKTRTDEQIYYIIATGNENNVDANTNPIESGLINDLAIEIYPEKLSGTKYFEITSDTNIEGINKENFFFEPDEKHYITDEGEVFILPGYLVDDGDSHRWYITESKYYTNELKLEVGSKGKSSIFSVGDYVDYTPKADEYTPSEARAGSLNQKLVTDMHTEWRIIFIDDGKIYITPGIVNVNEKLLLSNNAGYINSVNELNNICECLYSNFDKNITARSMDIKDVNKICNYSENITNGYKYYLKTTEFEEGSSEIVDGVTYYFSQGLQKKRFFTGIGGVTKYYETIPYQAPADGNPVYVKNTSYIYDLPNTTLRDILNYQGVNGWLASNCANTVSSYVEYCTFIIDNNGVNFKPQVRSSGYVKEAERRYNSISNFECVRF